VPGLGWRSHRAATFVPLDGKEKGPSGKILAVATGQTIRLWNITTGKQVGAPLSLGASALAFSPDGNALAVLNPPDIELWDLATRQQIGTPLHAGAPTIGDVPGQETMTFSPDGATLAGASFNSVSLWDVGLPGRLAAAACSISGNSLTRHDWRLYLPSEPFQQACPQPRNQAREPGGDQRHTNPAQKQRVNDRAGKRSRRRQAAVAPKRLARSPDALSVLSPLPALPLSGRELCGGVRLHLLQQNPRCFGVDAVTGSKSPPNRTSA